MRKQLLRKSSVNIISGESPLTVSRAVFLRTSDIYRVISCSRPPLRQAVGNFFVDISGRVKYNVYGQRFLCILVFSEVVMDIRILHHDKDIVVCIKPVGVSSENTEKGDGLPDLLSAQLGEKYIATLHRLDVGVGGVMAYALNQKSAAFLSREISEGRFDKRYFARVYGTPQEDSGIFEDLLFKDSKKNKSFVVKKQRSGVKKAKLSYAVLEKNEKTSLVDILLFTGRSHQIRVQFSSRNMPLVGDGKYGAKDNEKNIALMCHCLEFTHPRSGQRMKFDIPCTI